MKTKALTAALLSAALLAAGSPAARLSGSADFSAPEPSARTDFAPGGYSAYRAAYTGAPRPVVSLPLSPAGFSENEGRQSAALEKGQSFTFTAEAPETGCYGLELEYLAGTGDNLPLLSLTVDGALTFPEAADLPLGRVYRNSGPVTEDSAGNQLPPYQVETKMWQTAMLGGRDPAGGPYYEWHLTAGSHTVSVTAVNSALLISKLSLCNPEKTPDYQAYAQNGHANRAPSGWRQIIQAEDAVLKSASNLAPSAFNADPSVSPSDPVKSRLNVLGGGGWSVKGQWAAWEMTIPEDGYYNLGFKFKQNFLRGMSVSRKILIDDRPLFSELDDLTFGYGEKWQYLTAGPDGAPYRIYLKKGARTLKLQAVIGASAEGIATLSAAAGRLDAVYRSIIMITGVAPDPYRDYALHRQMPDLKEELNAIKGQLLTAARQLSGQVADNGSEMTAVFDLISQLDEFRQKDRSIPVQLARFESNIRLLSQAVLDIASQPLLLDYITLCSDGGKMDVKTNAGLWESLVFKTRAFLSSFSADYDTLGSRTDKPSLTAWISVNDILTTGVSAGRDQARLIKRLYDETFSEKSGADLKLKLVNTSDSLMMAVAGGKGPDIAMMVPKALGTNLAVRGALQDLNESDYIKEWEQRIRQAAFTAYRYGGGLYALPEILIFNMLYYRTDVFSELSLTVPDTWEDFYRTVALLQNYHLETGIPADQYSFYMFLLQRGQPLYSDDLKRSLLDGGGAAEAFREWTNLYLLKGIPLSYDFFNRFRCGQMPMGIAPLTTYNQLCAAAPELKNRWSIAPVPGRANADGTVNRSEACLTTATIMLSGCREKNAAFDFLNWWSGDETQARFGQEIENLLGSASRYSTANKTASENMGWTGAERKAMDAAWASVTDIPATPAAYYLERTVNNAFRRVTYYNADVKETLIRVNGEFSEELRRKWREYPAP